MSSLQSGLPALRSISIADVQHLETRPTQKIRTDEDVELWRTTQGYQDYGLFLRHLSEAVVGYFLPWSSASPSEAVQATINMLDALDKWIDEIPPLPTPQRFGNLAFRKWGKRLEDECDMLLSELLPPALHAAIPHISPYLLTSFGSFTRMDYGTGHETSFALFLLCLTLVRFFEPEPECERQIVLTIYVRYLGLCWKLQDVYNLEPAGSHGVWGLDDYSFLGYIFGSAQLRDQLEIPVNAILRQPLPPTNLYFLLINRIHKVKHGPFHEHSSQLYNIATGVQHWSKVNSGLFKMYEAEVLGKRVVVQHLPLGGLLEWNVSDSAADGTGAAAQAAPAMTQAPWAAAPTAYSPPGHTPSFSAGLPTYTPLPAVHARGPHASGLLSLRSSPRPTTAPHGVPGGPILPGKLPLGPLANTTLRPTSAPGSSGQDRSSMPPPPVPPPRLQDGDDGHPN